MHTNNYSKIKSSYGGCVGSIQVHATHLTQGSTDPNDQNWKKYIPGGFLPCDGTIRNARDYLALSEVLGVGSETKFKKVTSTVRDPDPEIQDLGQFQLPDLGSKVIVPSRSVGDYLSFLADDESTTRVGPAVEVFSNEGTELRCDFIGNFLGKSKGGTFDYPMKGTPKYNYNTTTSSEFLDIDNFQGHAHNISDYGILNYTGQHAVGGDGKDKGKLSGNSGSGNILDLTPNSGSVETPHSHRVEKVQTYSSTFRYGHNNFDIPADGVFSTVNVSTENIKKLDRATTPFIIVMYIIKF